MNLTFGVGALSPLTITTARSPASSTCRINNNRKTESCHQLGVIINRSFSAFRQNNKWKLWNIYHSPDALENRLFVNVFEIFERTLLVFGFSIWTESVMIYFGVLWKQYNSKYYSKVIGYDLKSVLIDSEKFCSLISSDLYSEKAQNFSEYFIWN